MFRNGLTVISLLGVFLIVAPGHGQETSSDSWPIECADGMKLDGMMEHPVNRPAGAAERIVILVHGSGAHSMDADLTMVTKDKQENLLFKTISHSLAARGFTVIRYNKRNYQLRQMLNEDSGSEAVEKLRQSLVENPLKHFVDDVLTMVQKAKAENPKASVYLLGHSEGTYVSLQAANLSDSIAGVGLIGFAEYSTSTLAYVQTVYRPLREFRELDANADEILDASELEADSMLAKRLKLAMSIVDQNQDSQLSMPEFQAANFANLLVRDVFAAFRKQEAVYPRVAEILKEAEFKVMFFQGMLDNQTPAFHAMAFQLLLGQLGKTDNFEYHFFPGLGHALDAREDYSDIEFSPIDAQALNTMCESMDAFFRTDVE